MRTPNNDIYVYIYPGISINEYGDQINVNANDPVDTVYSLTYNYTFNQYQRDIPFKDKIPYFRCSWGDAGGYIQFNDVTLGPNTDFTLDFWFFRHQDANSNENSRVFDFHFQNNVSSLLYSLNGDFVLGTDIFDISSRVYEIIPVSKGYWHHFALCYDSSEKTIYVFIDGIKTKEYTNMVFRDTWTQIPLWFGKSSWSDRNSNIYYQAIRIDYNCLFKDDFDCYNLNALKYPGFISSKIFYNFKL